VIDVELGGNLSEATSPTGTILLLSMASKRIERILGFRKPENSPVVFGLNN